MNREQQEQFFNHFLSVLNENRYPKLYEYLECSTDASPSTIKDQYKKLSLIYHPDRGGSTERMVQINGAYDILSNNDKRKLYDTFGTSSAIDWFLYYYSNIPKIFSSLIPIFLNASLSYFLDLKNLTLKFATDYQKDDFRKLGFALTLGFPLLHHIVEVGVSKLLDNSDNDGDKNQKQQQQSENQKLIKNYISETIATILAAPIEIMVYFKFTDRPDYEYGFSSLAGAFKDSASLISKNPSIRQINKSDFGWVTRLVLKRINPFGPSIKKYFLSFKYWRFILVLVGFRIGFSLLYSTLSTLSNYFDEKSKQYYYDLEDRINNKTTTIARELNDRLLNQQHQLQQESNDDENDESDDDEINGQRIRSRELEIQEITQQIQSEYDEENMNITNKHSSYHLYSKLFGFASYTLPSLFSIHRMFYKIEKPSIHYFSSALIKTCGLDSFSHFLFDSAFNSISRVSISLQYSIFKVFETIYNKSNKVNNNENNNNNNNKNNNNRNLINNNNNNQQID